MRLALTVALTGLALCAPAFDRAEWLGKGAMLDGEAERLRALYAKCAAQAKTPAENVVLPVETFPDGTVKSSVSAERAFYCLDEGIIWGERVTLTQRRADGSVEAEVKADSCVVDRETRSGWAEGAAKATYGRNTLSGKDVYFSLAERFFKVYDGTRLTAEGFRFGSGLEAVAAKGDGAGKPAKGAADGARATLTARRADYDNAEGVVMFDGAVRIDDGEYFLGGNRLWVFTDGTNDLSRIEVVGDVWVTNGLRNASCDAATYDRREGKLVMASSARTTARLVELGKNGAEICGETITFWVDSEQVEVSRSTVTIGKGAGKELWKRTL